MRYLITGGSGFLGTALSQALIDQGHRVAITSRDPEHCDVPKGVQARHLDRLSPTDYFDVVINLAGLPIADQRWSDERKYELRRSRLDTTQALMDWLQAVIQKPQVLISGSAIGFYGAQGETELTEKSAPQHEFVHQLCEDWEERAKIAADLNIRTVLLRTGIVLHPAGGMLKRVLKPFKLGLGGRLGNGQQWMSWISLEDWVRAVLFLIEHSEARGAFNLVAPNPVRNLSFTQQLSQTLKRPTLMPLPAWLLQLVFGEMSGLLLDSQRVLPERLLGLGFEFKHPTLQGALAEVV
ncbi:MAG: TIGR01777 family oxidoreductase [Pseudomonadota bacterium]|nr:TIGR01777 family oxidoreductase [Pseudomonadota bacterium]